MAEIKFADRPPTWLELESVRPLKPDVVEITNLPPDTIKREYPHLIVRLSKRRLGMKLRHALSITTGTAPAADDNTVAATPRAKMLA